jgi:hypothetical protein
MDENTGAIPRWLAWLTRPVWGYISTAILLAGSLALAVMARDLPVRILGWVAFAMAVTAAVLEAVAGVVRRRRSARDDSRHIG